jgi:macrolide transport system ATP-binding/permease protein
MRLVNILLLRLRSLFSRQKLEQELDEELRYHLERMMDEGVAAGITPEDARYAALQSIKDLEQRKEECRDARSLTLIDNTGQDLRYAIRQLRKSPGFAVTAIFVLALGISAVVTIFGFVDAALIQPLPYRDPSGLVGVFETTAKDSRGLVTYLDYRNWKNLNKVFSSTDAYGGSGGWGGFTLTTQTGAQHVTGINVTRGFFRTIGITPLLGRDFHEGEDSPAAPHTVLLSYAAWQKRFGGRLDALGRTVTLDGVQNIVIGVLPRDFQFAPAGPAEFWATLRGDRPCETSRSCHSVGVVARLKNSVSIQTALADMKSIAGQLRRQYPGESDRDQSANVVPLRDVIVGDVLPLLIAMLTGAGLLLLIACINVSSLLLARSDNRKREIAVRHALGASSPRLFRQFATEALVLAAAGCFAGLLFAQWGMRFLTILIPAGMRDSMPYLQGLGLNSRLAAVACAISLGAGVLFALAPITRLPLSEMAEGLKEGSRGSAGITWRRFGSILVVVELALTVVLLASAGLLGKSLYRLLQVDTGINSDRLATLQLDLPSSDSKDARIIAIERHVMGRLADLPGVQAVGISDQLPLASWGGTSAWFGVAGRPNLGDHNEASNRRVSPGYFTTLGARLLRGRYFTAGEDASKPLVAIINQTLEKRYFPGEDPIGMEIFFTTPRQPAMQIVGVVADIREGSLDEPIRPAIYVPFDQYLFLYSSVVVRTSQPGQSLLPAMVAAIHQIDPGISVHDESTMAERIRWLPTAYLHRSSALLVGSFATIAFLLGVVGLYGVVAYSVSQRTREIGVRMALGAEPASIYQLILREAAWLALVGTAAGIVCSVAAATLIRRLLFGVHSWDVPTLVAVAIVLVVSALLASYIPARRAASVSPVDALRAE